MIYVDDMGLRADVPNGDRVVRGRWSHLMTDGDEAELVEFARSIGLSPRWIQHPGTPGVHFDVTEGKRQTALAYGAQPITWHEAGEMVMERRRQAALQAQRDACTPGEPCHTEGCGACYPDEGLKAGLAEGERSSRERGCDRCGQLGVRLFAAGRFCSEHEPQPQPNGNPRAPVQHPDRRCGCGSRLTAGRDRCQACGVAEATAARPPAEGQHRDLSHGQPGHVCVLPAAETGVETEDREAS